MKHRPFLLSTLLTGLAACGGPSVPAIPPSTPPNPPAPHEALPEPKAATPPPEPKAPKLSAAELQRRAIEGLDLAIAAHDAKKLASLYAPAGVSETLGPQGFRALTGREAIERAHTNLFTAFPDLKTATVRVIAKGSVAVQEWVATGTQKGDFFGVKASGKPVGFRAASVYRFDEAGLIVGDHTYLDNATILGQIGAPNEKARAVMALPTAPTEWVFGGAGDEGKLDPVARALYGAYDKRSDKDFLAVFADDAVRVAYDRSDETTPKAGMKADFTALVKALTDVKVAPSASISAGDYVVSELVTTGTKKGAAVALHSLDVLEIKGGKVARAWTYASGHESRAQLGEAKPHARPPVADKPAGDKPAGDKPAGDKPGHGRHRRHDKHDKKP